MRFGVVFLTQKLPSTRWIVTYQVFMAGFAFPDILNDWVLSISLCYEHFSHDTGVTTCPLSEAVIEPWQQLISKQANVSLNIWNPSTPLVFLLATQSCNLVAQKIRTTQKTMHNQTLQKWATLWNTVTRYSLSQTLMSNALQYKASKGFRYIYYICRWWLGGVRHKFWEIWRGLRANLLLLRVGYCVIFLIANLIFAPPPSPPDNYCTVPKFLKEIRCWVGGQYNKIIWFYQLGW